MDKRALFTIPEFILSGVLLFFIQFGNILHPIAVSGWVDFVILLLVIAEFCFLFIPSRYKLLVLKRNNYSLVFSLLFVIFFILNRFFILSRGNTGFIAIPPALILARNFFIWTGIFSRFKKISLFFEGITMYPAKTILFSFLAVIVVGTILLMLPFATSTGKGLSIIDALFTSTSAVCVTGLIVVDTATAFSFWGKLIILTLIQIGGISIMILSYFTIFSLKKNISIKEKLMLSYMLNEKDMSHISKAIRNIIYTSFIIEGIGTVLLLVPFRAKSSSWGGTFFLSIFHAISAFCNAGFSLFSNSLASFTGSFYVNTVIASLIILGGLSFIVLNNITGTFTWWIGHIRGKSKQRYEKLQVNTIVILIATAILILTGMLLIYGLEHSRSLAGYSLGKQYLAAFFQSVTLRTAGFNTISFSNLSTTTLMIMGVFMFVGAAAGSTAGGIKINNVAVIFAYIKSFLTNSNSVVLLKHSIPKEKVLKSMLILLFGLCAVVLGIVFLSYFEHAPIQNIIFETISAFGTVGLSTGLTSHLTSQGKIVISILMFMGRLGPLTILAAASRHRPNIHMEFPVGEISIG